MDSPSLVRPARPLSVHRAFVVRLYADADLAPGTGRLHGQIEHVVSGEGAELQSVEDLLQFIGRVLEAREQEPASGKQPRSSPRERASAEEPSAPEEEQ